MLGTVRMATTGLRSTALHPSTNTWSRIQRIVTAQSSSRGAYQLNAARASSQYSMHSGIRTFWPSGFASCRAGRSAVLGGYRNERQQQCLFPRCSKRALNICAATSVNELITRDITFDDVELKFVRSGGAGGQNVNKVNTKVDMRLKLRNASFLSEELKQAIRSRERNRVNSNDELVIQSTRHRTQGANREDALERMMDLIKKVAETLVVKEMTAEQAKKQTKMIRRANTRRLENKKAQSSKKAERRRKDW